MKFQVLLSVLALALVGRAAASAVDSEEPATQVGAGKWSFEVFDVLTLISKGDKGGGGGGSKKKSGGKDKSSKGKSKDKSKDKDKDKDKDKEKSSDDRHKKKSSKSKSKSKSRSYKDKDKDKEKSSDDRHKKKSSKSKSKSKSRSSSSSSSSSGDSGRSGRILKDGMCYKPDKDDKDFCEVLENGDCKKPVQAGLEDFCKRLFEKPSDDISDDNEAAIKTNRRNLRA